MVEPCPLGQNAGLRSRPAHHEPSARLRFDALARRLQSNRLGRRDALWLLGVSSIGLGAGSLQGCAQSPVTGETIVVGMSEAQERQVDAQVAPHQFSQDLGAVQDDAANRYVGEVGRRLQALSHRPDMCPTPTACSTPTTSMPTPFPVAPWGSRAASSPIVEAELAALLGHEIAHVNARHAAQRQGRTMLAQAAVVELNVAAGFAVRGTARRPGQPDRCQRAAVELLARP